jgi:hypothetical protein
LLLSSTPVTDEALNYGEIFLRDNVPVMVYLLTQKRFKVVKAVPPDLPRSAEHDLSDPWSVPNQLC